MAVNTNLFMLVYNGEIDEIKSSEPRLLPWRYGGMFNFNEKTDAEVAAVGWYLVIRDEGIDLTQYYYSEPVIDITAKTVTFTTIQKSQAELDSDVVDAENKSLHSELIELEVANKVLFRLFMSLADTLITNGTISATDFTAEERLLFQQAKTLKPKLWN